MKKLPSFRAGSTLPFFGRRKATARPIGDLMSQTLERMSGKFGFSETTLILNWPEIVGAYFAQHSEPLRIQWPALPQNLEGAKTLATLIIQVEGSVAIELQHSSHIIMERIHTYLGWRCIGKLVFKQEPLQRKKRLKPIFTPPSPHLLEELEETTQGVDDISLRKALKHLGRHVLQKEEKDTIP